jgi:chromatin segregation and condensation protein Rec8/ScpA/Scc1 (kleisin family)
MLSQLQEDYEVHIGAFEGPMDLLLYLVQKNEVAPSAISIAEITDQYLAWMKDLTQADLSKAGDFLLMASRLMAMKVRELLPKEEQTQEAMDEFDLERDEFIRQMLEYQRYKQVAKELQGKESDHFGAFYRGRLEKSQSEDDTLADANIWQLFRAFQKSLKSHGHENIHHIELDYVTIEDRQQFISNYLARNGRALFEDLLGRDAHPIVAAVTFMALMEMIKTDEVVFRQSEHLGPIWLYRRKNNTEFAEEMANETTHLSDDPELDSNILQMLREREKLRMNQKRASIDAVMREAALWASEGRMVRDDDIMAMLEGRMALAEDTAEDHSSDEMNVPELGDESSPEFVSPPFGDELLENETDGATEKEYDSDLLDEYSSESDSETGVDSILEKEKLLDETTQSRTSEQKPLDNQEHSDQNGYEDVTESKTEFRDGNK